MGLAGEGQGTASGIKEDSLPKWGVGGRSLRSSFIYRPRLIMAGVYSVPGTPNRQVPVSKEVQQAEAAERGEVGTGCLLSLPC